jgi:pilus assembly protein CpaF
MDISALTEMIRRSLNVIEEDMTDDEVREYIEDFVFSSRHVSMQSLGAIDRMIDSVYYSLRSDLGILQPYIDDKSVNEIMVNGKDDIFIEKNGRIVRAERSFATVEELEEVIRRVAGAVHREINELSPIVDARLSDGSRVNAVYRNIALNGPIFTIRKFPEKGFTMEDLIQLGTLTRECADYLDVLVKDGFNCFISGGTSSGKTTFLNVLADYIPSDERLIVIEDSA